MGSPFVIVNTNKLTEQDFATDTDDNDSCW